MCVCLCVALPILWDRRADGWENYKGRLGSHGWCIMTRGDFKKKASTATCSLFELFSLHMVEQSCVYLEKLSLLSLTRVGDHQCSLAGTCGNGTLPKQRWWVLILLVGEFPHLSFSISLSFPLPPPFSQSFSPMLSPSVSVSPPFLSPLPSLCLSGVLQVQRGAGWHH